MNRLILILSSVLLLITLTGCDLIRDRPFRFGSGSEAVHVESESAAPEPSAPRDNAPPATSEDGAGADSLPSAEPAAPVPAEPVTETAAEVASEPSAAFSSDVPSDAPTERLTEASTEAWAEPSRELFLYKGLTELTAVDDRFIIDQRYATENNFTGRVHYDRVLCLVQEDILPMLIQAADLAEAEGCRIKIWDAYRPISVQQALHDSAPAELSPYVPAPGPWSMHARGITVDVTLCDLAGNELDMPTGFDDFSPRANSDNPDATQSQIANRELLNRIMSGAGFTRSRLEWWHFDGPNRDHYQVLDVSFAEFEAARAEAEAN